MVIPDDLGSLNYLLANLRMDLLSIPFLKDIHLKPFIYTEVATYP